ncbi:MAG: hypothetical protein E6J53_09785 [Chloroflexi bacterium]|nr:MAG: hypothetical protein E6J53_09785 [Chloroflexota bacterium]
MTPSTAPSTLRWLPYLFAAGAVFWLVELAQLSAVIAAPVGREELKQALLKAGLTSDINVWLAVETGLVFLFEVTATALHATAYYGMRKLRLWGWIAAVMVAVGWSLVLIGLPVLIFLLRRPTRQAFGIS